MPEDAPIELPPFETLVTDRAYRRPQDVVWGRGVQPGSAVLVPSVYFEASTTAVTERILEVVFCLRGDPSRHFKDGLIPKEAASLMAHVAQSIPDKTIDQLHEGYEEALDKLAAAVPQSPPSQGKNPGILEVHYGLIPQEFITRARAQGNLEKDRWTDRKLREYRLTNNDLGLLWEAYLPFDDAGLPHREDALHDLSGEGLIHVQGLDYLERDLDVRRAFNALYDGLPSDFSHHLLDTSDEALYGVAHLTVATLGHKESADRPAPESPPSSPEIGWVM